MNLPNLILQKHTKLGTIIDKINKYDSDLLIIRISKKYWKIFKKGKDIGSGVRRKFISTAHWICFFSIGMDNNHYNKKKANIKEIFNLSNNLWPILDIFSIPDFQKNGYKAYNNCFEVFLDAWKKFWDGSFNWDTYLSNLNKSPDDIRKIKDTIRKAKSNLCEFNLRLLPLDKIYTHIYLAEGMANRNREIEIKYSCEPVVRSLALYRELIALMDDNEKTNFECEIKKLLGCSSLVFHQIFNLILVFAIECDGSFSYEKLCEILCRHGYDKTEAELTQIKEDIRLVLDKLSYTQEDIKNKFANCRDYLSRNPSPIWSLNPFYTKPIYLECIDSNVFIIPSPYIAIFTSGWIFWSELRQNSSKPIQELINKKIGEALENYTEKMLNFYKSKALINITRLDVDRKKSEESADFLLKTEKYFFIVELKNSLGLRNFYDKNASTPESLIDFIASHGRIAKSFAQCRATATTETHKALFNETKKAVFKIVVVNETVLGEIPSFLGFYDKEFFDELELEWGKFAVLSMPQFENIIASGNLEIFADNHEKQPKPRWDNINFNDIRKALNICFNHYTNVNLAFWEETTNEFTL